MAAADHLSEQVRRARCEVFRSASLNRRAVTDPDLLSDSFENSTHGFHLLETLPEGTQMRWMSRSGAFFLEVNPEAESLNFTARSSMAGNAITVLVQESEAGVFPLQTTWTSGEVDLTPYRGTRVRIELRASRAMQAPGDSRELSAQFSELTTMPRPKEAAARRDEPRPVSAHTDSVPWIRPTLPDLPPFSESSSAAGGAVHTFEAPPASILMAVKYFRPLDAISEEVLCMADLLRKAGFQVRLVCEQAHASLASCLAAAEEVAAQVGEENSMLILHHGTAWDFGRRLMQHSRARFKVLRYHNVTKSECFLNYPTGYLDPTLAGRFETSDLARHATHCTAPSFWALGDLAGCGARPDRLLHVPFLHDLRKLDELAASAASRHDLRTSGRFRMLILGRQVPSKGLHHCVRILAHYRQAFGDGISMEFVGARDPLHREYFDDLERMVAEHGLGDAVTFQQEATRAEVAALLQACDALLTMSESDAVCVPILEAGWFGKPIVGYMCGGKSEQAGPGQMLFESLDPHLHATAWHRLATDRALYDELGRLARQHVRTHFDCEKIYARFLEAVRQICTTKV